MFNKLSLFIVLVLCLTLTGCTHDANRIYTICKVDDGVKYCYNSDGFYVAGGYWFNMKNQRIRPVARYDFLRQDIENPEKNSTYYMAGIDWWPYNNLRLLVNYTIKDKPGYENLGHLFQAQLSVKF